jgi:hypothetical protein
MAKTADEKALGDQAGALRHALQQRLNELSDMSSRASAQIRTWSEPRGWERILDHKMTAVHEAAALLHAAEGS